MPGLFPFLPLSSPLFFLPLPFSSLLFSRLCHGLSILPEMASTSWCHPSHASLLLQCLSSWDKEHVPPYPDTSFYLDCVFCVCGSFPPALPAHKQHKMYNFSLIANFLFQFQYILKARRAILEKAEHEKRIKNILIKEINKENNKGLLGRDPSGFHSL